MTPLLFIKHKDFNARTVDNDVTILSEQYEVTLYDAKISKGVSFFIGLIRQFFYLLLNTYRFKVIFIWFADYHSLLPVFFSRLIGKVCVINIGGYDADEILIGKPASLKTRFRKFCVSYSVKHAAKLFPVSNIIKSYLETAVKSNKCETIYCCVDPDDFIPPQAIPHKENLVITVGGGGEFIKEAKRKRLDLFIKIGQRFNSLHPQYKAKFCLIGHNQDTNTYVFLSKLVTDPAIELKPMTSSVGELIEYYKRASIYMQLSYYEAFGIAQVEAMLYGCIPVSNDGGAIGEVVGDSGFVIKDYDEDVYLTRIKEIFDRKHENLREKASFRASKMFSLQNRRDKLLREINKLIS